ncbi:uncharacterized protein LOC110830457 [Zootermopsis nevadensis]|uniref:uncharacterized protein LOC110830457 n=1 Tax=Zootermopsis nevadensis TaxID=136037 RepID=UPI000B8EE366|nr:uncharacterized protein LOC110830457 [Zootermopsis nevadensis]XP_021921130.1 uncharacterized protein LOC110830457 [Zootermopsis nevadensis]
MLCASVCTMRYTLEQKVFMYDAYIKHKSFVECCVAFIQKYPGVKLPRRSVVRKLVTTFRRTGSLLDEIPGAVKRRNKGIKQMKNKLQNTEKTSRPVGGQYRRTNGPTTRAITRNSRVSSSDTETQQDALPFTFVGIKQEVEDKMDIIDLETDSDSDIPEPSEDMQFRSVKEEPLETSSSEMSDSDSKKELEVDTDVSDGGSGLDSDTQENCDKTRLISVKEEPPDTSSSELSEQEPFTFTCVNIKEEVQDSVAISGVQSDSGASDQALTVTSGCRTFQNEALHKPVVFASVDVKCEVEGEVACSDE